MRTRFRLAQKPPSGKPVVVPIPPDTGAVIFQPKTPPPLRWWTLAAALGVLVLFVWSFWSTGSERVPALEAYPTILPHDLAQNLWAESVTLAPYGLWWAKYTQLVAVPDTLKLVCADVKDTRRIVTFARTQDLLADVDYEEDRCWRLWDEPGDYRLSQLQFVGWFYTH